MKFTKLLKESQFHGGRRLAEGNFRWYWYISMLVLFGTTVTVICATIRRFVVNPTFEVSRESVESVSNFPSVQICPEIYFTDRKVDRFLAYLEIPPNLNISYLKGVMYMLSAFYASDIVYKVRDLQNIEHLLETNNVDVDTAARLLTTSCKNTLIRCRWNGFIINCSLLFRMELTSFGYCCVFNGKSLRDLHEVRHHQHPDKEWSTNRYGHDSGLMLAVNQSQPHRNVHFHYKWVKIQTAGRFVESSANGFPLNPGLEYWLQYHETSVQIEEDARQLSNELKQCRMTSEPLKYFPYYRQIYCMVECELEATLKRCSCVQLVHPRAEGSDYCKAHQLLCAKTAMAKDECSCPRSCAYTKESVQSKTFALMSSVKPIDSFYDGLNYDKVTLVRVFLKNNLVQTKSRWSYFSSINLFAQLGGVFNVFFGCSILTLLELTVLMYRGIASRITAKARTKPQSNQTRNRRERCEESKISKKKVKVKLFKS